MSRHSQFIELLYKDFFKSALKQKVSIERNDLSAPILKTIIKCLYTDRKFHGTYSPKDCADRLKKVLVLTECWSEQFSKICSQTLLLYKKNEDDIRFFDYLLRLSQNKLPELSKMDRRKSQSNKIQFARLDETIDQMLDAEGNGRFYINDLELFDQTLNYASLKEKMERFANQFNSVIGFYSEYYETLPDGLSENKLEGFNLIKPFMWQVYQELTSAVDCNSKNKIEQDLFIYWCYKILKKRKGTAEAAWSELIEINKEIGLKKNLSESNRRDIGRNARQEIIKNKEYQRFDGWVDLS